MYYYYQGGSVLFDTRDRYNYVLLPNHHHNSSSRRSVRHPLMYKMGNSTIRFQKPLVAAIAVVFLALLVLVYVYAAGGRNSGHSNFDDHYHYSPKLNSNSNHRSTVKPRSTYNSTYPLSTPTMTERGMRYRIAIIADLDEASKVEGKKDQWRSYLKKGYLYYDADATDEDKMVSIEWDEGEPAELRSSMSTGGRGMELSELIVFNGKLFTVDDRTGVIYQVEGDKVVPWQILADGPGTETKGFKSKS